MGQKLQPSHQQPRYMDRQQRRSQYVQHVHQVQIAQTYPDGGQRVTNLDVKIADREVTVILGTSAGGHRLDGRQAAGVEVHQREVGAVG